MPGNYYGSFLIDNEEISEVVEVLKSKSLFRYYGPKVLGKADQFENDFKNFIGSNYALGVSSGTAALKCALKALNIGDGDEVIVPAYGFIATAGAVVSCNATPVFCDVDDSLNLDPNNLERCISENTKAIIPVHIMGGPANMKEIMVVAQKSGIAVVEDVAQSFGGIYQGEKLGSIGDLGCYSFQANKIMSTGEGGGVTTNKESLYQAVRVYHDQGGVRTGASFPTWNHKFATFGENFRMSELIAAIGIAQLKKVPKMLEKTKRLRKLLRNSLENLHLNYRTSWDEGGDCCISECFYVSNIQKRNVLINHLQKGGINAHGYYNEAVYENQLFRKLKSSNSKVSYHKGLCPNAEMLSRQAVWLPISPLYSERDILQIALVVKYHLK